MRVDQRRHLLLKNRKLIHLIFDGPYKNTLNAGCPISCKFFGTGFRRADKKALPQLLDRAV